MAFVPLLVPIAPAEFDIDLDLRYATADNLTGRPIYCRPDLYLHPAAAEALRRAVALVRPLGLRLRIFDGFRPVEAQWRLWRALPDPRYVADPRPGAGGSAHSRGVALDLTLADAAGMPLDMGTGFDEMTSRSHHGRTDLDAEAQRNRLLLLGAMGAAGWQPYAEEWWHYQLPDARRYPALSDSVLWPGLLAAGTTDSGDRQS